MLTDNLKLVKEKIAESCKKAGRSPDEVTLVAVSKTKPIADIQTLYEAGQRDFGENYVQELREKAEALPKDIRWHMIGHLQRNKVKYIAEYIAMIHSVDSLALAETIDREAAKHQRIIPILIEVNAAAEESKYGVSPEEAPILAEAVQKLAHVDLQGFMTSAPLVSDPEENRIFFKKLKKLSVDSALKRIDNRRVGVCSMGMSNDYQVAVEEGSTMVRVGTSIFGNRIYKN
ncbi:MAG: YggS family pyridoxal phosphate-dependent enzyme [Lachnospiraceae bacterium]|nr:YggS family pyridoxal phosphate-dependent enzyme [Lachnospiraceae bacterium]